MAKINKTVLIGVLVAIILIVVGIMGIIYYQKGKISQKEEIKEEEKKDEEKKELEETLEELTPKNPKPMTPQEKKELEELLKKLTP